MAHTYTRTTYIWFVAATITGVVSGFLHFVRSHIGDGGDVSLALTILAFSLTGITALLVFRGIMVAAYEQDRAAERDRS